MKRRGKKQTELRVAPALLDLLQRACAAFLRRVGQPVVPPPPRFPSDYVGSVYESGMDWPLYNRGLYLKLAFEELQRANSAPHDLR